MAEPEHHKADQLVGISETESSEKSHQSAIHPRQDNVDVQIDDPMSNANDNKKKTYMIVFTVFAVFISLLIVAVVAFSFWSSHDLNRKIDELSITTTNPKPALQWWWRWPRSYLKIRW